MNEQSLYDEAVRCVARSRSVSALLLQSRLEISYNQAARIIEKMEEEGVVSQTDRHGRRCVQLGKGRRGPCVAGGLLPLMMDNDNDTPDYVRTVLISLLALFVISLVAFSL